MKKGIIILIIGVIFIIASIGIGFSTFESFHLKAMSVSAHGEKTIEYNNLKYDNYTLILATKGKIHYALLNSTGIILQGNVSKELNKNVGKLKGDYTIKITNLENSTTEFAIGLIGKTTSGFIIGGMLGVLGLIIIGIILIIVGIILAIIERKNKR